MKILVTKEKLNEQICLTPCVDVIRLNVDGVDRYDVRFVWLKWAICIGTITSALRENFFNKL